MESASPQIVILEPGSGRITDQRLDLRADVGQSPRIFGVHRQREALDEPSAPAHAVAQALSGEPDPDADQQEGPDSSDYEDGSHGQAVARGEREIREERRERGRTAYVGPDLEGQERNPGQQHRRTDGLGVAQQPRCEQRHGQRCERERDTCAAVGEDAAD